MRRLPLFLPNQETWRSICQGATTMRFRRRHAWSQDDTVEVVAQTADPSESDEDSRETARRVVNDSRPMVAIRRTIEEKGLDPIWIQLIAEFGTMMYLQGRNSRPPPNGRVPDR